MNPVKDRENGVEGCWNWGDRFCSEQLSLNKHKHFLLATHKAFKQNPICRFSSGHLGKEQKAAKRQPLVSADTLTNPKCVPVTHLPHLHNTTSLSTVSIPTVCIQSLAYWQEHRLSVTEGKQLWLILNHLGVCWHNNIKIEKFGIFHIQTSILSNQNQEKTKKAALYMPGQ